MLASSSPHRRQLLQRLGLPFSWLAPDIDEGAGPGEDPERLAMRLATAKSQAVAARRPGAIVIGSDQVAVHADLLLGKPGSREQAMRQLLDLRGTTVRFVTGLHVIDGRNGREWSGLSGFNVRFRHYTESEVGRYLDREQPFSCTASFKSEQSGIALVESMAGDDPTGLVGLPLIQLCEILRQAGLDVP